MARNITSSENTIFDVTVELLTTSSVETSPEANVTPSESEPASEAKRPVRERRSPTKKRATTSSEMVQGDLWG